MYKHWEHAYEYGHPTNLDTKTYFKLFEPAIDWLFYCAGNNATEAQFKQIMKLYNSNQKQMIYLKCIILYYPSIYITKNAEEIMVEMGSFG